MRGGAAHSGAGTVDLSEHPDTYRVILGSSESCYGFFEFVAWLRSKVGPGFFKAEPAMQSTMHCSSRARSTGAGSFN